MILEHVCLLNVIVVHEVDVQARGTVAQVLGHHVAGGESSDYGQCDEP